MRNIQFFHAGTYICVDSDQEGRTFEAEAELIVIDGKINRYFIHNKWF